MIGHAYRSIFTSLFKVLNRIMGRPIIDGADHPKVKCTFATHSHAAVQHKSGLRLSYQRGAVVYVLVTNMLIPTGMAFADQPAELKVEEVGSGVFVHRGVNALMTAANGGAVANVGFVVGNASVAVIDTGGSRAHGEALRRAIEKHTDLPVRYVINTHMHPDHVFGNAAFLGPDVAFVGHERLPEALRQRFEHYLAANRPAMGESQLAGTELVLPTVTVSDTLEIDLGGRVLTLKAWPAAHTDNDLTVLDSGSGTLFTGDLVFLEHLPSIDGSLRGWQQVLGRLAEVPAARVIPGHGPLNAAWPAALEPERRYFQALARDLKAAIDAGTPLGEAVTTAAEDERGSWLLFDEFNRRNATAAYAELEWE